MLKVNNKGTSSSSVSIVNFEHVFIGWDDHEQKLSKCSQKKDLPKKHVF